MASSSASPLALRTLAVVEQFPSGDVLAYPVMDPSIAAHATDPESALDDLHLYLSEALARAPATEVSRHALPADATLLQVYVPLPTLGDPPKGHDERPHSLRLGVPVVLLPIERGAELGPRWALVPSLAQTMYLGADEPVEATLTREVARLLDARRYDAESWAERLPGGRIALAPLMLEVARRDVADAEPGAGGLRRRLERATKMRFALEVLSDVALPLHASASIADAAPTVGRDDELRVLAELLEGEPRRSVLLVAPSGAGKSALFEQWVRDHASGASFRRGALLPRDGKRLAYQTSGAQLVAGMSYLGQWQARLARVVDAAEELDAVLYLSDLRDLFDARTGESHVDLAGALKPALEEGRVRVVAELTPEAHDRLAARHEGFFASFHVLGMEAQDRTAGGAVLAARAAHAEEHAPERPRVTEEGQTTLLHLAERYLHDRAFPGKAARLFEELRDAADRPGHRVEGDLGGAAVVQLFSLQTGIPEVLLRDDRAFDADRVAATLRRRVVGQDAAVRAVAETLAVVKAALQPADKPLATFLFTGPTGVGKTELCRALAGYLYGAEERLLRFDMSELAGPAAVQRLVSGDGRDDGLLTRRVRQQPFAVVLFDEVEKAHPSFFDLLLQIAGEGRLTDGAGRVASFKNTLVILTSNLGARHEGRLSLGFQRGPEDLQAAAMEAVRAAFRPELVGRLDRIIAFRPLAAADAARITGLLVAQLAERRGLSERGATLLVSPEALEALAAEGTSPAYGARALRRHVDASLATPLAAGLSAETGSFAIEVVPSAGAASLAQAPGSFRRSTGPLTLQFTPRSADDASALKGLGGVFALRREVQQRMRLPAVEALAEAEAHALARTAQLFAPRKTKRGRPLPPPKADGAEVALLEQTRSTAEKRLGPLREAEREVHALEELLLDAMQAREPPPFGDDEPPRLRRHFRRDLLTLLLEDDPKHAVLVLATELDDGRSLDPWLTSLLEALGPRGWEATFHLRGDRAPPSAPLPSTWPSKPAFGPPRAAAFLRERLEAERRDRMALLLRLEGPHVGTFLACQGGLHRVLGRPPLPEGAHHAVAPVAYRATLAPARDFGPPALAPPAKVSRPKLRRRTAARLTDVRANPERQPNAPLVPWGKAFAPEVLDELTLAALIPLDEAGTRDELTPSPLDAPTAEEAAKARAESGGAA